MNSIKVKKLSPIATFERAHDDDVGYDLTCVAVEEEEDKVYVLSLGVSVTPPEGTSFRVYPRSSFPLKTGWIMLNGVGVIDPGYTGEWKMVVRPYIDGKIGDVKRDKIVFPNDFIGMKVAQAVLYNTMTPIVEIVDELTETERGVGGFGSTGTGQT